MRIGIRPGCLRTGWRDGLVTAAELGFDTLEPDIGADYASLPLWSEAGRQDLMAAAAAAGCSIDSLCLGAFWQISPANSDPAIRAEAVRLLQDTAASVAGLGVRWILLPVTPGGQGDDYEGCVARWIEAVRASAPIAAAHGVTLCIENVGGGCGRSAAEMMRIIDAVGSPAVKAYYDMGNAVAFGFDPLAEIAELGERIAIVHIKDDADRLGAGHVPVAACLAALQAMNYPGILVFETNATADPKLAATYNLGYVRGALAALEA